MSTNKVFLVFETVAYEGDHIDKDVTKAFHTVEDAKAYVAELEAADRVERAAYAKRVILQREGDDFLSSFYGSKTEEEIAEVGMRVWQIQEIALG